MEGKQHQLKFSRYHWAIFILNFSLVFLAILAAGYLYNDINTRLALVESRTTSQVNLTKVYWYHLTLNYNCR